MTYLAKVGLHLNVGKTNILTTQSQSPSEVPLRNGQVIEVVDRGSKHKWLGCMLCTASSGNHAPDLAHHLQAASKAFFARRPFWSTGMLLCEAVSNILTPWSLLLLVSVLRTEKCTNKTCAGWILCFAGYDAPLLGRGLDVAVAWNPSPLEWASENFNSSSWLENMVCCVPETILDIC